MPMLDQDKILNFLKVTGPTFPTKVAKNIRTEILIASAHLSDLASQGKVKISHLKMGGSPLYYLPGQEEQLYNFAAGNMNPKDLQILDLLRERRILRESYLDLLGRVAIRHLQDFALPLKVRVNDQVELFWKWHLLPDDEINPLIKSILMAENPLPEAPAAEVKAEVKPEVPAPVNEVIPENVVEKISEEVLSTVNKTEEPVKKEDIRKSERSRGRPSKANSHLKSELKEKIIPQSPEPLAVEKSSEELERERELSLEKLLGHKGEKQKTLREGKNFAEKEEKSRRGIVETFLPQIEIFFAKLEIKKEQQEILRKNAEINFQIKVPSVVGPMLYFCKAKNKNKCDEKDLSAAYMEAQMKKLPLLFLYSTELSKKAQEMLDSGAFANVMVKKVE